MPIKPTPLCVLLLLAAASGARAEAPPGQKPAPQAATDAASAPAHTLAVVEFDNHLDKVDELRKGAFRSSHASTVIRNAAADAAPFLDVLPSQEVEARLEELIAAGKNTGTGSGNVLRVARAMRT